MLKKISLVVSLALASTPALADRIGGSAKADFKNNILTVPCVLVENLDDSVNGQYFDIILDRRGNSFNYELNFVELEDGVTCDNIANFAEFEDVDLDDSERGQGRGRGRGQGGDDFDDDNESDNDNEDVNGGSDDDVVVTPPTADGVRMFLKCEVDSNGNDSEVDIDVKGLIPGAYTARVTSGSATVESSALDVRTGETVEFEFDSDPDVSRGETQIPGDFIQNRLVLAELVDAQGSVVVSAEASCKLDN